MKFELPAKFLISVQVELPAEIKSHYQNMKLKRRIKLTFCNLSSPMYGSSIIPTRSASKSFAYFWKQRQNSKINILDSIAIRNVLHIPASLKTVSLTVDLRRKTSSTSSLSLDWLNLDRQLTRSCCRLTCWENSRETAAYESSGLDVAARGPA